MLGALPENFTPFLQGMGYGLHEMLSQHDRIWLHTTSTALEILNTYFRHQVISDHYPVRFGVTWYIPDPNDIFCTAFLRIMSTDSVLKYRKSEKWNIQPLKTLVLITLMLYIACNVICFLLQNQKCAHVQIFGSDVLVLDRQNCLVPIRHFEVNGGHCEQPSLPCAYMSH
jgi:hypothetical protein